MSSDSSGVQQGAAGKKSTIVSVLHRGQAAWRWCPKAPWLCCSCRTCVPPEEHTLGSFPCNLRLLTVALMPEEGNSSREALVFQDVLRRVILHCLTSYFSQIYLTKVSINEGYNGWTSGQAMKLLWNQDCFREKS